jgi:hypothetical protein
VGIVTSTTRPPIGVPTAAVWVYLWVTTDGSVDLVCEHRHGQANEPSINLLGASSK